MYENLKKNKMDLNVWKITLVNIRIIFSPTEYKKNGKDYLEKNFNLIHWNFQKSLHFIPFLFGFFSMIQARYENQTFFSLFGQTIPGTQILNENSSWETFKFFKTSLTNEIKVNNIDVYPTHFILKIKPTNINRLTGIIFPKQKVSNNFHKISSETAVSIGFDHAINFNFLQISDLYYNLDEIPLKIEHISSDTLASDTTKETSIFSTQLQRIIPAVEKTSTVSLDNRKLHKNGIVEIKFSFDTTNGEKNILKGTGVPVLNFWKNVNRDVKKKTKAKKQIVENELNLLFYKEGISLIDDTELFSLNQPNPSFFTYCPVETIQLLEEFLPIELNTIDSLRKFSGYRYPDLSLPEVYSLGIQTTIKKNENNKFWTIQFPSIFFPSIKNLSLVNLNSCSPLPITGRKDNFLGAAKEEKLDKLKNSVFQEAVKRENQTVEDIDDSDPDTWFLHTKNEIKKGFQLEHTLLDSALARKKRTNNGTQLVLGSMGEAKQANRTTDETYFTLQTKIKYHFPEFTQNFLVENKSSSIKIGEIYKRRATFPTSLNERSKKFEKLDSAFFESWEPISSNSWLLVTQFSIGLFLLHLVKDLYKDYGKELVEYVLQFASSSGIDVEEIKEQYLYEDKGHRLIRHVKKNFKDIAGIDVILLEIGEMVWFLRNKGRSAKLKNSIPTGILLTGPPGTGKTLLVQAIAGEAQVPIIVESGSLLTDPQQKGRGVERLKKIFDQARNLSPCIIFIDEVDTLGEKRQNIIQTTMGSDELIESIYEKNSNQNATPFTPKPLNLEEKITDEKDIEYQLFRNESENTPNSLNEQTTQNNEAKRTRLSLLTQFLVEMDGLKQRQGVIVIGATNRPNVLDPALIRPGRFDKIINLEVPGKQKRIEILKLYSKNLKTEKTISWEYLAHRTRGFSAADIAAAMNESTIKAIIKKTTHTVETIEYGIDLVTSYNTDSSNSDKNENLTDPFLRSRLAYYQSGKALLQSLLENHPPVVVLHLWPRQKNARHQHSYENKFSGKTNRKTLEAELIGLYAGKASELVSLCGNRLSSSLKRWQSNLGNDDLISATFLANLLVDKWYFYSLQILIRKNNLLLETRNEKEFPDVEKSLIAMSIENDIEDELEIEKIAKLSRVGRYQQRGFGPWWQIQVSKQTSEMELFFADWYRLYLPDPEENILNLEWLPPDEYYHTNNSLKTISEKSNVSFNELYKIERDYIFHGLLLNSFNFAFDFVEEHREFLDYFSDYLLRFEILRENEIKSLLKVEQKNKVYEKDILNSQTIKTIKSFWGVNSRRKTERFLNLKSGIIETTNQTYESPFTK